MLADDGKVLVGDDLKRPKSRRKFCTATNPIRLSFTNTKQRKTSANVKDIVSPTPHSKFCPLKSNDKGQDSKHNGSIVSVECDGHTGYGVEGEDIVCSALSSIVQTAALGLMQVAGIDLDYEVREEDGYLKFTLPRFQRKDAATPI